MNFEIVSINWGKSIPIAKDTFKEAETLKRIYKKIPSSSKCIYQAYGSSIIYGENKLLYIGQTEEWNGRLGIHIKTHFNRILNLSLSIGNFEGAELDNKKLKLIESILICYLKPSYNSENIKDIYRNSNLNPILILNKGNRGSLPLECSNYWWLDKQKKTSNEKII